MYGGYFLLVAIAFAASRLQLSLSIDYLIRTLFISILGFILYAAYWGSCEKEKKYGRLDGEIEVWLDGIRLNDTTYTWSEINKVVFWVFQIVDEML